MNQRPTVHFIWLGSPLPPKYKRNIQTYKNFGYPVKVWTEPLPEMINRRAFDAMRSWAGKADIMRLEILYRMGGIYTDVDSAMKKPLPLEMNLVCMTSASGFIGNETMYANKGSKVIKAIISGIENRIEELRGKACNIWDIAGATYMTPFFLCMDHIKLPKHVIGSRNDNPSSIVHSYDHSWKNGHRKAEKRPLNEWLDLKVYDEWEKVKPIPKNLFTIWVGDMAKCPHAFIDTWEQAHLDWNHTIFDNETLYGRQWKNQSLIDTYLKEKRYPGVADVMRYELLHEIGGFCHPADSICLHPIDNLLDSDHDAYGVYENEKVRPGLVSPLYACSKGNSFAKYLIDNLPSQPPKRNGVSRPPWIVTGNKYMRDSIKAMNYDRLKIWPSYRFTPIHHTGERYEGKEKVYACQQWGATSEAGIGVNKYEWKT